MANSLLTTAQARWALDVLVSVLSGVAIASSAPNAAGGSDMYSGQPGDIRGLIVLMGSTGLIGVALSRVANLLLSKPWRLYLDRLEFTLVAMLWIGWTSATMAFSAFAMQQGVCSPTLPEFMLPTCPLLSFDLTLLHLLSTATLALLLVIMSSALSPRYYASLSNDQESPKHDQDAFVMWELALASAPSSPRWQTVALEAEPPSKAAITKSYGTLSPTSPLNTSSIQHRADTSVSGNTLTREELFVPPKTRDKFAEGRVWTYLPLGICSAGVACATVVALNVGDFAASGIFILVVSVLSLIFSLICLKAHFSQKDNKSITTESAHTARQARAFEVASAAGLFLLWPIAAVLYTLFPSTPFLPCSNPSASAVPSPREDADLDVLAVLCWSSRVVITLAWTASWLVLGRVVGLVFPMPNVDTFESLKQSGDIRQEASGGAQAEGQVLLKKDRGNVKNDEERRPQVGWGRIVAGEDFELGSVEDDDDEYS